MLSVREIDRFGNGRHTLGSRSRRTERTFADVI
jgi:hypothetical protein